MKEKTLKLVLTGEWFRMIESGEKTEEYRDYCPYWLMRLTNKKDINELGSFDFVEFYLGYNKDRRSMKFECKGIHIGKGKEKWGALKGKKYYVISLGKKIEATPLKQIPRKLLKIDCRNNYNKNFLYYRRGRHNYTLFHNLVFEAYSLDSVGFDSRIIFNDGDPANCHFSNLRKVKLTDLVKVQAEHDEFNLTDEKLDSIITEHNDELWRVKAYLSR